MTDLRKAAEMALWGLKQSIGLHIRNDEELEPIIEYLEDALAQPEQKPVDIHCPSCLHSFSIVPVAKRQWVSLTDEEIFTINHKAATDYEDGLTYARAIEATLRSKNT